MVTRGAAGDQPPSIQRGGGVKQAFPPSLPPSLHVARSLTDKQDPLPSFHNSAKLSRIHFIQPTIIGFPLPVRHRALPRMVLAPDVVASVRLKNMESAAIRWSLRHYRPVVSFLGADRYHTVENKRIISRRRDVNKLKLFYPSNLPGIFC